MITLHSASVYIRGHDNLHQSKLATLYMTQQEICHEYVHIYQWYVINKRIYYRLLSGWISIVASGRIAFMGHLDTVDNYHGDRWINRYRVRSYLESTTAMTLHWRHNGHDGVSNHQPHGCLLNRLFRRRSKKTSKLRVTGLCVGNSPGPVNSPHKWPVTRKMVPFDDVIMAQKWTFLTLQNVERVLNPFNTF